MKALTIALLLTSSVFGCDKVHETKEISDTGDEITPLRAWNVYNFDMTSSVSRCQKRNGYPPKQPLRMKIDTIGWSFCPSIHRDTIFITDTTYYLSPEQLGLLGY